MTRLRLTELPPVPREYRRPRNPDAAKRFRSPEAARERDRARFKPSEAPELCAEDRRRFKRLREQVMQTQAEGATPETLASLERYYSDTKRLNGHLWCAVDRYGLSRAALVTLRPRGLLVNGSELGGLDPQKFKRRLTNHLRRAGVIGASGFLFMALDAEFDKNRGKEGVFDFHWHGIVAGDKVEALENLRSRWSYHAHRFDPLEAGLKPSARVHVQRDLHSLPTPIEYCLKGWVPHRPTRQNPDGSLTRAERPKSVPSPYLQQWLLWMDQWTIDDLVLLNGIRPTKQGLKLTQKVSGNR